MKNIDPKAILSGIAILVSLATFALSFVYTKNAGRVAVRPVLAFVYDGKTGWSIKNIGNGPALNVIITQRIGDREWFNPVRIPPLRKDGEFLLTWLGHTNITALGARYDDINGEPYSSTCQDDLTKSSEGNVFPRWKEETIGKHWNQPLYDSK